MDRKMGLSSRRAFSNASSPCTQQPPRHARAGLVEVAGTRGRAAPGKRAGRRQQWQRAAAAAAAAVSRAPAPTARPWVPVHGVVRVLQQVCGVGWRREKRCASGGGCGGCSVLQRRWQHEAVAAQKTFSPRWPSGAHRATAPARGGWCGRARLQRRRSRCRSWRRRRRRAPPAAPRPPPTSWSPGHPACAPRGAGVGPGCADENPGLPAPRRHAAQRVRAGGAWGAAGECAREACTAQDGLTARPPRPPPPRCAAGTHANPLPQLR